MEEKVAANSGNFLTNFINVFFSPRKTMASIDHSPKWVLPFVVLLLLIFIFTLITSPVSIKEGMEKQRTRMEQKGLSDEEIDNALQVGEKVGKVTAPILAVVGAGLMTALIALIIWFVGNVILGGIATYKKVFTMYIYSSFISMLGMFIKLPLILSKGTMDIHFSLASFFNPDSLPKLFYSLLRTIEVFQIWQFFVLAIGFAIIYKFSMKKSAWAMVALFVIYAFFEAGIYSWQM